MITLTKTAKRGIISLLFFLLTISFVYAFDEYPYINFNDNLDGAGTWNSILPIEITQTGIPLINSSNAIVWGDIDGTGNVKLVIHDDDKLKIINSNDLDEELDYDINGTGTSISNIVIYDMDDDGRDEIVFINNQYQEAYILNYSSSTIQTEARINVTGSSGDGVGYEDSALGCNDDGCFFIAEDRNNNYVWVGGFDYNGNFSNFQQRVGTDMDEAYVISSDYDLDGTDEFIGLWVATSVQRYPFLISFSVSGGDLVQEDYKQGGVSVNCAVYYDNYKVGTSGRVTPPITADIAGDSKLEIIYGRCRSGDKFDMVVYDDDFTAIGNVPEILLVGTTVDGRYYSNLFKADYDGDNDDDVCMIGYGSNGSATSTLLCVDEDDWFLNKGEAYTFNTPYTGVFESPPQAFGVNVLALNGKDEIMDRFGTYYITSDVNLEKDFSDEMEINLNYYPVHDDGTDFFDIIGINNEALYYFDDGYNNFNCVDNNCLSYLEVCPAVYAVEGKTNTTFRVRMNLSDFDGDDFNITFTIYDGESNEQTITDTIQSDTLNTYLSLKINQSTTDSIMTFSYYDVANPDKVTTEQYNLFVADDGEAFDKDDCGVLVNTNIEWGEDESAEDAATADENAVESMMGDLEDQTSLTSTAIWLILMALCPLVGVYILFQTGINFNAVSITGSAFMIGIVEIFLLIVGFYFGFLSSALLWLIVFLGVLIIGGWIYSLLRGG